MPVDVVLPCLNEASALPWVLSRIPPGYRAIVADNGSTDDSVAIARGHGAEVVNVPRRGFGAACHAGLLAATSEIVAIMDADASFDPADLDPVTAPVRAGSADLVLGRRVPTARGAWPWHARQANRVLAGMVRRRCGCVLRDIGPLRALRREPGVELGMVDRRFGYPLEMVVRAAQAGWVIQEIDVRYLPRSGRSKVTGTLRGTLAAVHDMRQVLKSAGTSPM